jgi:hypothetical protein
MDGWGEDNAIPEGRVSVILLSWLLVRSSLSGVAKPGRGDGKEGIE